MQRTVEFKTKMFPEREGEKEENVNGFVGKAFCEWVRDELPRHGQGTENDIIAEDWGWMCYLESEFPLWIGCNNLGEDEDGYTHYIAMVVEEFPKRLFRKSPDPLPCLDKACLAFRSLLDSEKEILDIEWAEGYE